MNNFNRNNEENRVCKPEKPICERKKIITLPDPDEKPPIYKFLGIRKELFESARAEKIEKIKTELFQNFLSQASESSPSSLISPLYQDWKSKFAKQTKKSSIENEDSFSYKPAEVDLKEELDESSNVEKTASVSFDEQMDEGITKRKLIISLANPQKDDKGNVIIFIRFVAQGITFHDDGESASSSFASNLIAKSIPEATWNKISDKNYPEEKRLALMLGIYKELSVYDGNKQAGQNIEARLQKLSKLISEIIENKYLGENSEGHPQLLEIMKKLELINAGLLGSIKDPTKKLLASQYIEGQIDLLSNADLSFLSRTLTDQRYNLITLEDQLQKRADRKSLALTISSSLVRDIINTKIQALIESKDESNGYFYEILQLRSAVVVEGDEKNFASSSDKKPSSYTPKELNLKASEVLYRLLNEADKMLYDNLNREYNLPTTARF